MTIIYKDHEWEVYYKDRLLGVSDTDGRNALIEDAEKHGIFVIAELKVNEISFNLIKKVTA